MRSGPALVCAALVTLQLGTPLARTALAADPPPGAADPAREHERGALYQQGVELAAAGKWSEAVERFRKVVEIRASPKVLYTLGEAEEHAGQLAAAKGHYTASVAAARAGGVRDVADAADEALRRIAPRVPHVTVRLDDRAAHARGSDTRVTIDSRSVPLETSIDVDPGPHEVRVEAAGVPPFVRDVQLAEGQSEDVVVGALERPPAATAPPSPVATPAADEHRTSPLIPAAVGAAGLVAGVVGLVIRLGGQSDYDAASAKCSGGVCPSDDVAAAGNGGRNKMIAGTVVMGVGGAVAAVGVVWWALSFRSSGPVQAGVTLDGAGARAVLGGTF
jgi:hypothetical protein